jgi:hypothetical protein
MAPRLNYDIESEFRLITNLLLFPDKADLPVALEPSFFDVIQIVNVAIQAHILLDVSDGNAELTHDRRYRFAVLYHKLFSPINKSAEPCDAAGDHGEQAVHGDDKQPRAHRGKEIDAATDGAR